MVCMQPNLDSMYTCLSAARLLVVGFCCGVVWCCLVLLHNACVSFLCFFSEPFKAAEHRKEKRKEEEEEEE